MTNHHNQNQALVDWCKQLIAAPIEQDIKIVQTNQLIITSGLLMWSLCDQFLPFWCHVSVGQVSSENAVRPQALVEIVKQSPRPQSLELLVNQIADEIERVTGAGYSIAVRGSGGHLCQMPSGVQVTTVNCLRGEFKERKSFQLEFFIVATKTTTPDYFRFKMATNEK